MRGWNYFRSGKTKKRRNMQKITPYLWYDNQAEEAANFYTSILKIQRYGPLHVMTR